MKIGEMYEALIDGIGEDGEGVCRPEGFTLFVNGAVVGDKVRVRVTKLNKTYGFAALCEILEPSKDRVEPPCPSFGTCGGCSLLHTDYAAQLKIKEKTVRDALTRIGGFDEAVMRPITPSKPCMHYRNKAQYPVTKNGAGFYARRSHNVVSADDCALQDAQSATALAVVREYMAKFLVPPYDEERGSGVIRHVCTRVGKDEMTVTVVTNASHIAAPDALCDMLRAALGEILVGVVLNINRDKTNRILGERDRVLFGRDYIIDTIGSVRYKISYKSFYQVNPYTTYPLYQKALELADAKDENVLDLYCGCGTISLFLAQSAKSVVGVEISHESVRDARECARINGIENVRFFEGAAEDVTKDAANGEDFGVVVLDPPRKGCDKRLLDTVIDINPKRIVYVSCNPATLARDAKILQSAGYELKEAHPFDQFPHTTHVETVVLMSKAEK